jgi:hypothetical protein
MGNRNSRTSHWSTMLFAIGVAASGAACHDSTTNAASAVAASVVVNTGSSGQTGTVGQQLAVPVSVHVTDQNGTAVVNSSVAWTLAASSGSVDSATTMTNANGDATVLWTLGTVAGGDTLTATISSGTAVIITATANAGSMANLISVGSATQAVTAGTSTSPLVVKATDQFGNAVPNANITWTASAGAILSASSGVTDANGLTSVIVTTDPSPGSYTITASGPSGTPVTFSITGM